MPTSGSGLVYFGNVFAFPATSTLSVQKGFASIHRPKIEIFDVTNAVEIQIPVSIFNAKLGIVKLVSGSGLTLASSTTTTYDASNQNYLDASGRKLDAVTLSSSEFVSSITDATTIVSVGRFSSLYADFANYVASYFGLTAPVSSNLISGQSSVGYSTVMGFSTLFSGDYGFDPNGGVFDTNQLYNIIHGNGVYTDSNVGIGTLQGSITLFGINRVLNYALTSNCFDNRRTGGMAVDPSNNNNYTMMDGFVAGDVIFVPTNGLSVTLNMNVNYQSSVVPYAGMGLENSRAVTMDQDAAINATTYTVDAGTTVNGVTQTTSTTSAFKSTTITNDHLLSRTVSCPLLIRLV